MTQIEKTLSEVAGRWRAHDVELFPPASRSQVDEFERRFGVRCPDDFTSYLLTLGGFGGTDNHLMCFWPLHEIEPDPEDPSLFLFADWSICAALYAIQLSGQDSTGVFLIGYEPSPKQLASSFTEFLMRYRNDVEGVHLPLLSPEAIE